MPEPLATYTDRLLQVTRQFSLYHDHLIVHARWRSGREFTNTVRLADLKPQPRQFYVRYKLARWAGWVLASGMLIAAAGVYLHRPPPLSPLAWVGLVVGAVGLVFVALTYPNRRVLFARFDNKEGKSALDLAKAGPERNQFDAFVARIRKQINAQ